MGLFYRTSGIVKGDMEHLLSDTRGESVPKIREVAQVRGWGRNVWGAPEAAAARIAMVARGEARGGGVG